MLLQHLLILLTAIWIFRRVFQWLRFPSLFGEIFAGFVVGPMMLGWVTETEAIRILAELGVFFLMFHAGLEFSPKDFFKSFKIAVWVALGSFLFPFFATYGLSIWFGYDAYVAVFIALLLSVSSVEISARMFKDSKLNRIKIHQLAITAAIIVEVFALLFFSMYLDIFQTRAFDPGHLMVLSVKVFGYFFLALWVGQKGFHYLHRFLYKGNKGFTLSLIIALFFGVFAEFIGLHFIIGAFLAGLFLQKELIEIEMFDKLEDRVFGLSYSFLGPIFFASLAFHLDITSLMSLPVFALCLSIVGFLTKIFGSAFFAFINRLGWLDSLGVGLAMNNRGALALVLTAIGLDQNILSPELFSVLVFLILSMTFTSLLLFKPVARMLKYKTRERTLFDGINGQQNI